MKAYKALHITAQIIAFGLMLIFLVYLLTAYPQLPERIGVHFSPIDGKFDVYSYKLFAFYPFAAGGALLLLFSLLTLPIKKLKKPGMELDEKGETVFRQAAVLLLDLMKLIWAVFFSYWTYCVVHQTSMGDGSFLDAFRIFFLLILLSLPILFSEIKSRHGIKKPDNVNETDDNEAPALPRSFKAVHIFCNIACFGSLGAFLVYFLLSYEGLPERIGVHFGSGGEFDVYSYKVFGFYPFAAGFGLLLIFSLMYFFAKKIKRTGMDIDKKGELLIRRTVLEALDVFKLICSVLFSMWSYCVINQRAMDGTFQAVVSLSFFALFPITAVLILIISKTHKNKNKETDQ